MSLLRCLSLPKWARAQKNGPNLSKVRFAPKSFMIPGWQGYEPTGSCGLITQLCEQAPTMEGVPVGSRTNLNRQKC